LLSMLRWCHCFITIMDGVLPFSENGTHLPSSAKKNPIWHFCCSRELIFAELGKKAPFSEKGAVITGALNPVQAPWISLTSYFFIQSHHNQWSNNQWLSVHLQIFAKNKVLQTIFKSHTNLHARNSSCSMGRPSR
jgi:hypothetical protein